MRQAIGKINLRREVLFMARALDEVLRPVYGIPSISSIPSTLPSSQANHGER